MHNRRDLHGKLKLAEYRVLMTIWDYNRMPSLDRLSADTLLSKPEVHKALRALKRQGYLHDQSPSRIAGLPTCLFCGHPIFEPWQPETCRTCQREVNE